MRRKLCGGILVAAAVALWATNAAAQETGTPMFKAPYRAFTTHEFGAAFSDPGEGVSYAMEGFYSYGKGPYDFSIRGGWLSCPMKPTAWTSGAALAFSSGEISEPGSFNTVRASLWMERSPSASAPTWVMAMTLTTFRSASRSAGVSTWKIPKPPLLPMPIP